MMNLFDDEQIMRTYAKDITCKPASGRLGKALKLQKRTKTKRLAQPIAKLNVPDARRVLRNGLPCLEMRNRM